MLTNRKTFIAALAASCSLAAGAAWAANPPAAEQPKAQMATDKDFSKLSTDGASAFQDVMLTRLAIFDGKIADAKKYVNLADTAFTKAKGDDTVFMKAEADLKPVSPPGKSVDEDATAPSATKGEDMKKPIAWLPVDGSIAIDEDYTADAKKSAAVNDANSSLKAGDRQGAMEKLKLAGVKVAVTMAIVPLQQTTDIVHKAAGLINDGKYYEASQELRQAQNDQRFVSVGNMGTPKE